MLYQTFVVCSAMCVSAAAEVYIPIGRRAARSDSIEGGVDLGYIYTTIYVGPEEEPFTVILDTGSPLTIIPCQGCHACGHDHQFHPHSRPLSSFNINYVEGSSLRGRYFQDSLKIASSVVEDMEIGCATTMTHLFKTQFADGICRLDDSPRSIVQTLIRHHQLQHNTFSISLSSHRNSLGIGVNPIGVEWIPMNYRSENYFVQIASVGPFSLPSASEWLVDSGTTFLYLQRALILRIRSLLKRGRISKPNLSDVGCFHHRPSVRLDLISSSGVRIPLRADHYVYRSGGLYCVGIFDTGFGNPNTLGLIAMQERETFFHLDNKRIAFQ